MKALVINNGTKRIEQIKNLLSGHYVDFLNMNDLKIGIEKNYDLVVLTGGHGARSNTKTRFYDKELEFIKNSNKPIFGICKGMQLICRAFGSKITYLGGERVRGVFDLKLNKKTFGVNNLKVFESHLLAVTQLGEDLDELAKSKVGIEIIKHRNKPIIGVQFHPEADGEFGTNGRIVFDNFMKIIQQ